MALTADERVSVLHHLGYPAVGANGSQTSPAIVGGVPVLLEPLFVINNMMNILPPAAENRVRKTLQVCDGLENQMVDSYERLQVEAIDEITIGKRIQGQTETDALKRDYDYWTRKLAKDLGGPRYPYADDIFNAGQAGVVGNGRVIN